MGGAKSKKGGDSSKSSSDARGTLNAGKGREKTDKLCNEITDPPHWGSDVPQSVIMIISNRPAAHIRVISADTNLGDQGYRTDGLTRSVLDETQQTMPVKFSANTIRVNGTCMN